jgi:rRNA-processing protein FCF1
MLSFMLDTNAINAIGYSESFLESMIAAVKNERITLYITHIQRDEIKKIPDTSEEMKSRLLNFIQDYCRRIPTTGAICGISACGECGVSNGVDIDAIRRGNLKMIHDALIAATAKIGADYLVTDDDKLRERVVKELPTIKILTNDEFYVMINS